MQPSQEAYNILTNTGRLIFVVQGTEATALRVAQWCKFQHSALAATHLSTVFMNLPGPYSVLVVYRAERRDALDQRQPEQGFIAPPARPEPR